MMSAECPADSFSVLLVTHDAKVAARADRVIYLKDGKIKDEFRPGKYKENSRSQRERRMKDWLEAMKF